MMKKHLVLFAIPALIVGYSGYFNWSASDIGDHNDNPTAITPQLSNASAKLMVPIQTANPNVMPIPAAINNRQLAAQKQREIERLMAAFEQHKFDPVARVKIKQQIDRQLRQYNQLTLPIALSKMKTGQ